MSEERKQEVIRTIENMKNRPFTKMKSPQRRASSILNVLKNEEFSKLKDGRNWPEVKAGDSVEILRLPFKTAPRPDVIRGLVLGKYNKFSDTHLMIANNEYGTPIFRNITIYNPLIKDVRVLQNSFIHGGKKRTRRSKLYYMLKRDPSEYTVKYEDEASRRENENPLA